MYQAVLAEDIEQSLSNYKLSVFKTLTKCLPPILKIYELVYTMWLIVQCSFGGGWVGVLVIVPRRAVVIVAIAIRVVVVVIVLVVVVAVQSIVVVVAVVLVAIPVLVAIQVVFVVVVVVVVLVIIVVIVIIIVSVLVMIVEHTSAAMVV